jgi:hypothetical protein
MSLSPAQNRTKPVPFWNRLREIALYPFRGSAVITLILLTCMSLLGFLPGLAGLILTCVVWFSAYKFAFEILRSSADGDLQAPESMFSTENGTVWRFLALQIVLGVLVVLSFMGGLVVGLGVMVLAVFLQPGMIMSLAIDGSFSRAIDPSTPLAIVGRIGGSYFAAFGLLFVIQASAGTASSWVGEVMPPVLGELAVNLFSFWGLFATFHLMGYLVYQYHEELGYEPASHARAAHTLVSRDRQLLDAAEARIRDGDNVGALQLLREEVRSRAVDGETHELYRRLLRQAGDVKESNAHAQLYLNLLMMEKQDRKALGLLREALEANPDFVPMQIEHAELLAQRARMGGQAQLALDQWQALLRRHPKEANAPRWALDAALVLSERFGRDADARVLLEQARTRCDDAALQEKIEAALKPLQPA